MLYFAGPVSGERPVGERMSVEIDSDVAEIARLASLIEAFGERNGLPDRVVFHLQLAFDELLTNIIFYGFPDGGPHKIETTLRLDDDRLVAEIVDGGVPFDPLAKPPPDVTASLD